MAVTKRFIEGADFNIAVETAVCMGRCQDGPTVKLAPRGEFIENANVENVQAAIIRFIENTEEK